MGNRITIQFVSNNYDAQGNVQSTFKSGVLFSHWAGMSITKDVYEFLTSARRDGIIGVHCHYVKERHEDDPDYGKWYARNKPFKLAKDRKGDMVWQCPICKCAQKDCANGEWVNDKHMYPLDRLEPDVVMFNFIVYLGMRYGKRAEQTHHKHAFPAMEHFPYVDSNYRVEESRGDNEIGFNDNQHQMIDIDLVLRHIENDLLSEDAKELEEAKR
tara:strand:+ start:3251 stop:3892 length:642 start_codon:yes stop_codon:yes gene_type:complete